MAGETFASQENDESIRPQSLDAQGVAAGYERVRPDESSEPAGTRTQDLRIDLPHDPSRKSLSGNTSGASAGALTRPLHADAEIDLDLSRILDVWPRLPPEIKAAVLALVAMAR